MKRWVATKLRALAQRLYPEPMMRVAIDDSTAIRFRAPAEFEHVSGGGSGLAMPGEPGRGGSGGSAFATNGGIAIGGAGGSGHASNGRGGAGGKGQL